MYDADEETLHRLFRLKIRSALADAGYDEPTQAKVTNLVGRNVVSCGIALRGAPGKVDGVQAESMQPRLEDLMNSGFRINSNEPVLMILIDCAKGVVSVETAVTIKEATCSVLGNVFGIFPVRVYVAQQLNGKSQTKNSRDGFSLALLNVVNTDIGGPGMIQLLDSQVNCFEWDRMVILAEGWNRSELLWRNSDPEIVRANLMSGSMGPEVLVEHEPHTDKSPGAGDDVGVRPNASSVPVKNAKAGADSITSEVSSRRQSVSRSVILVEHPEMTELLTREASRPTIQHPTWEHVHMEDSLIDLVRMQASRMSESESVDTFNESVPGTNASTGASEADFEFV